MSHVCGCAVRAHGRPAPAAAHGRAPAVRHEPAPATGVKGYSPLLMG